QAGLPPRGPGSPRRPGPRRLPRPHPLGRRRLRRRVRGRRGWCASNGRHRAQPGRSRRRPDHRRPRPGPAASGRARRRSVVSGRALVDCACAVTTGAATLVARTSSVGETQELAAALAGLAQPGDLVVLAGDLGAGKTAFVQGFGRGLGVTEPITSPTFTLAQQYAGRLTVHHLDVYRLDQL